MFHDKVAIFAVFSNTGCYVSEYLANKAWCLFSNTNCHFKLLTYNSVCTSMSLYLGVFFQANV